jgi:hypothetical protein
LKNDVNVPGTSVPDPDPYVFEPPGSASGSVSQKYGSVDLRIRESGSAFGSVLKCHGRNTAKKIRKIRVSDPDSH